MVIIEALQEFRIYNAETILGFRLNFGVDIDIKYTETMGVRKVLNRI